MNKVNLNGKQSSLLLNEGQSLFEVMFAVAVIALMITGIVSLATKSVKNSDFSQSNAVATKFAAEGSEWTRAYRDYDWDSFKSHSSTAPRRWCINTLPTPPAWGLSSGCGSGKISGTQFGREVVLQTDSANPDLINVTIEVKWDDGSGTHVVQTKTNLSKWKI